MECISQGLRIKRRNGARAIQLLQRWIEDEEQKRGYILTKTPLMAKRELTKSPVTGITTWMVCSFWVTPTTRRRSALPSVP